MMHILKDDVNQPSQVYILPALENPISVFLICCMPCTTKPG